MHQSDKENVLQNLEHYLDCYQSQCLRSRRETVSSSKGSKVNLCPSTSQNHHIQSNPIVTCPESLIGCKPVYENSILFTPPDQLSPPPSPVLPSSLPAIVTSSAYFSVPLCLPFGHSVSPPSTSPHVFTISACSLEKLHQPTHAKKYLDINTPPSLNLALSKDGFPLPAHTTWRPWSWTYGVLLLRKKWIWYL